MNWYSTSDVVTRVAEFLGERCNIILNVFHSLFDAGAPNWNYYSFVKFDFGTLYYYYHTL